MLSARDISGCSTIGKETENRPLSPTVSLTRRRLAALMLSDRDISGCSTIEKETENRPLSPYCNHLISIFCASFSGSASLLGNVTSRMPLL